MARLEAVVAPVKDGVMLRDAITRQVSELGGTFIWFDNRNASIALTTGPRALAVEVLLELRSGSELVVLVRSREVMSNGGCTAEYRGAGAATDRLAGGVTWSIGVVPLGPRWSNPSSRRDWAGGR